MTRGSARAGAITRQVLADLDGDGRDEIVAAFAGEPMAFALPDEQCRRGGAVGAWRA